jgi:hypothetical protein
LKATVPPKVAEPNAALTSRKPFQPSKVPEMYMGKKRPSQRENVMKVSKPAIAATHSAPTFNSTRPFFAAAENMRRVLKAIP